MRNKRKQAAQTAEEIAVEVYTPKPPRPLKNFRKGVDNGSRKPRRTGLLTPANIAIIERRYQVVKLRTSGTLFREIAQELNISEATAYADLKAVLFHTVGDSSETKTENRQLATDRLDGLLKAYYEIATEVLVTDDGQIVPSSMAAAQLVLQIESRRAKLLALDEPETKGAAESSVREYVGVDVDKV